MQEFPRISTNSFSSSAIVFQKLQKEKEYATLWRVDRYIIYILNTKFLHLFYENSYISSLVSLVMDTLNRLHSCSISYDYRIGYISIRTKCMDIYRSGIYCTPRFLYYPYHHQYCKPHIPWSSVCFFHELSHDSEISPNYSFSRDSCYLDYLKFDRTANHWIQHEWTSRWSWNRMSHVRTREQRSRSQSSRKSLHHHE